MYFYNWGGTKIPIVLQPVGGVPTSAALAVEQLQRWLRHAQSRSCGHGPRPNLPDNVWQCEFTITESDRVHDATIRWTATGTATITTGPRTYELRSLDGRVTPVHPGDAITITEEPRLAGRAPVTASVLSWGERSRRRVVASRHAHTGVTGELGR